MTKESRPQMNVGLSLITAREFGEMLISCGDIPVKLRTFDGDDCVNTLLQRDSVSIHLHSASGTVFGDIAVVALVDVYIHDNA